jgi:UDP-N-acetyl-2-amino-2-deoxyglucuronate dehydrogenase
MPPRLDFGHTSYQAAFERRDVYGVRHDPNRRAKRLLRVGVVGCGGVAQAKWLPAIRYLQTRSEPVEIAGLVDPDSMTRSKVAALYGAATYAAVGELLERGAVDLILVLCPDEMHGEIARQALAVGVASLVEKPLCRRTDEARALCKLAEERGVLLASVANKRFSPPYALARALVADGALRSAPTVFSCKFTLGYPYVDLLEAGTVHVVDLALWFMGPVERVFAIGAFRDGKVESAIISLNFASGAVGAIVTSAAALSFKPWERVEIIGRNAVLVVEDQFELTLYDEETGPAKSWKPTIPNTLLFDESFGGYAGLLENVLDAIRGLAPLGTPGREGLAAVEIVAAVHESLARGEAIELGERTQGDRGDRMGRQ